MNADGTLTVPAGVTPGSYTATYQICSLAVPTSCDTATVSITVAAPVVDAVNDPPASIPATGGTVPTVVANDTVNGAPAVIGGNISAPTLTNTGGLAGLVINADGTLTVPAGVTPGQLHRHVPDLRARGADELRHGDGADHRGRARRRCGERPRGQHPGDGRDGADRGQQRHRERGPRGDWDATSPPRRSPTPAASPAWSSTLMARSPCRPASRPGSYTATYQICALVVPTSCDTATVPITVAAPVVDAVNDPAASIPATGGTVPTVVSNDTVDGAPAVIGGNMSAPTLTNNGGLTGLVINADGTLTVPAGVTPGTYTATYQICSLSVPTSCDTATVPITVAAPVVDAVNDPAASIPATGGTVPSVVTNDTVDGAPAVIGGNVSVPTLTNSGGLAGLVLNADGTLTVPAGVTPGSYTATYQICALAVPTSCDAASIPIAVAAPVVDAVNDAAANIPATGGTVPTVVANDTVNGTPAVIGGNISAPTLTNTGGLTGLLINSDGTLTVPAGLTPGTYTATYQICALAVPTSCDTATVPITVAAPVVDAVNDPVANIPATGGTVPSVVANDTVDGVAAVIGSNVSPPTLTNTGGLAGLAINGDGTLTVPAGVTPGSYTATYQICALAVPTSCDSATVPITVAAPVVDAVNDPVANIPATGGTVASVVSNDTVDGAAAVVGANIAAPTLTNNGGLAGLVINGDGTLTVPAGVTPGSYTATYQICALAVPTSCDTASIPITVAAPVVDAVNDAAANIPATGGTVPSVVTNDTVNGAPAVIGGNTSAPTLTNTGGLTGLLINGDGTLTVPAGVTPGSYTATYQICALAVPTSCDTATVPITVAAPVVDAVNDAAANIPATGGTVPSVVANDTVDGVVAVIGSNVSPPTLTNTGGLAGLAINGDGTLTVPAGVTPGTYTATYQICALAVPTSCDSATVPITVAAPVVDAVNDPAASIPATGGTVPTVVSERHGQRGPGRHRWEHLGPDADEQRSGSPVC